MPRGLEQIDLPKEALPVSVALSQSGYFVMAAQSIFIVATHEATSSLPLEVLQIGALLTFFAGLAIGIAIDVKAFQEAGYCANPVANIIYARTGKPLLSSILANSWNLVTTFTNPVDAASTLEPRWTASNVYPRTALTTFTSVLGNYLIISGKVDNFLNGADRVAKQLKIPELHDTLSGPPQVADIPNEFRNLIIFRDTAHALPEAFDS